MTEQQLGLCAVEEGGIGHGEYIEKKTQIIENNQINSDRNDEEMKRDNWGGDKWLTRDQMGVKILLSEYKPYDFQSLGKIN